MQIIIAYVEDDHALILTDWRDAMEHFGSYRGEISYAVEIADTRAHYHSYQDLDAAYEAHREEIRMERRHNQSLAA